MANEHLNTTGELNATQQREAFLAEKNITRVQALDHAELVTASLRVFEDEFASEALSILKAVGDVRKYARLTHLGHTAGNLFRILMDRPISNFDDDGKLLSYLGKVYSAQTALPASYLAQK